MELAGKVIAILEAKGGVSKTTGNPWKTQDYVIETVEQFPHRMVFNVFGEDKINQFNIQMGEEITVSFDINAREFNGRWYNDIRAWKIERGLAPAATATAIDNAIPAAQPVAQPATTAPSSSVPSFEVEESADNLPF